MDYALVGYPLSNAYQTRFEAATGSTPTYLGIPELRRMPMVRLLKMLLRLNADRLFIALESESSRAFLPIFYCLAGLAPAHEIELVHPDLRRERISRGQTWRSMAAVMNASVAGRHRLRSCRRELAQLARAPRIDVSHNNSRRVLYLKTNLWAGVKAGGSVGHVAGVVNALAQQKYDVEYAAIEPPLMVDSQVRYLAIEPPSAYGVPYELNLYRFQDLYLRQLRRLMSRESYGFLYQRMSVSNYAGVLLSREQRVPLVLEYNGSEVWASTNWGASPRYRETAAAAEDMCLKHAHLVVTVSQALGDELISRGVEPQRVVVYPNCIDPGIFDPAAYTAEDRAALRSKLNIAPDAVLAGFVGTFGQWHGVEILAEAIRRMAVDDAEGLRRSRLHFLIVGDGLKMPAVRAALADPRCAPFYTLTGLVPQAEAPRYMAAADMLLSPHVGNADGSRFFGSPTKLFEYMALGKPIVASDLEQIGDVLRQGLRSENLPEASPSDDDSSLAVLCPPGDVEALIRGVRFLADRGDWRSSLGAAARREVLAKYTWDRHVAAILDRLASLVKAPS
jgi:glycosyltransferase involved in cell wall biosynthesis